MTPEQRMIATTFIDTDPPQQTPEEMFDIWWAKKGTCLPGHEEGMRIAFLDACKLEREQCANCIEPNWVKNDDSKYEQGMWDALTTRATRVRYRT